MTGIIKTIQKITPKEFDPLRNAANKYTGINQPKKVIPKAPVIPLPDEEALATEARRNRPRNTGRAATFLSEDEKLGP